MDADLYLKIASNVDDHGRHLVLRSSCAKPKMVSGSGLGAYGGFVHGGCPIMNDRK